MAKKSKKSEDKQVKVAVKKAVKAERKKLEKAVDAAEEAAARAEKAAAKAAGRAKSAKKASKKASSKAPVDSGESTESVAPERTVPAAAPLQNVEQDAQLSDASAKVAGDPLGSATADTDTPADDPHVGLTRAQLVVLAGERGVPNRSRLTKAQLLEALRDL